MTGLKRILGRVQKPGRYMGEETNSVRKNFSGDKTSIALAYPDTYEVGMSYLGLRILYHLLNERDDCLCERVFAPWDDMEKELTAEGLKLFSLESKTEINRFDIVGFSLSYELTYTNVLNMLHLSGITVLSQRRGEDEPLVIAGGACCYNPEPMTKFIDVFLIGDAEESILEFVDEYKKLKRQAIGRKKMLRSLAKLPGVYVPALYKDGRPVEKDVPSRIEKRLVDDLENAYYPVKQIVPLVKIVHDRIAVEVMRGCPNRCRFCQAGAVNRPVRLRSPERVRSLCLQTYQNTGYEQIALLSLSSINYPYLTELVRNLNDDFRDKGVGISIPSLRVDEKFYDLPEMVSSLRKGGLTFAPESADYQVRQAIRKDIDPQVLCKSALQAYSHGWRKLKLYFMVGFTGKKTDEASKIIGLARDLSQLKKKVSKGAAEIKVSVNAFIPKPQTPFQWLGMRERSGLAGLRKELLSGSGRKVQIEFHDIDRSALEACMARGDRKIGDVIYTAWKKGAKMDGWSEFFDFSIWKDSFAEHGVDLWHFAGKSYALDDKLPWSHISAGVDGGVLKEELAESGLF
ncbi:MAG: TIGR03960 family B12-binding radical SAM protein [Candidatus Omnitrophota bacterium]